MIKTCLWTSKNLRHLIVTKNASSSQPEFILEKYQVLTWWQESLMNSPKTMKSPMHSETKLFSTSYQSWILMEWQEVITESTRMVSISIVVTSIQVQKTTVQFMRSRKLSCIFMKIIDISVFWICMLTPLERVCLFMEILQMILKNKSKHVFSQRFCQWTLKISNTKVVISHKRTCTLKTEEIICQSRVLEEWLFLRLPKMLSVGLWNVITTWIDTQMFLNLKKLFKKQRSL